MKNPRSTPISRVISLGAAERRDRDKRSLESEWIITNGIGGYAWNSRRN